MSGVSLVKSRLLVASSALAAVLATTGCHTTGSTTPNTTEQIRPGIANATAFQNLPRVRSLERASGRSSVLVRINGVVNPYTGRVLPRAVWEYEFAETVSGGSHFHIWDVTDTGAITVQLNVMLPHGVTEIGPFLAVDTDEASRLAREYGGQRYLDRYPGAGLQMESDVIAGIGRWAMTFRRAPVSCAG